MLQLVLRVSQVNLEITVVAVSRSIQHPTPVFRAFLDFMVHIARRVLIVELTALVIRESREMAPVLAPQDGIAHCVPRAPPVITVRAALFVRLVCMVLATKVFLVTGLVPALPDGMEPSVMLVQPVIMVLLARYVRLVELTEVVIRGSQETELVLVLLDGMGLLAMFVPRITTDLVVPCVLLVWAEFVIRAWRAMEPVLATRDGMVLCVTSVLRITMVLVVPSVLLVCTAPAIRALVVTELALVILDGMGLFAIRVHLGTTVLLAQFALLVIKEAVIREFRATELAPATPGGMGPSVTTFSRDSLIHVLPIPFIAPPAVSCVW